jgi:CheY-specific phosphatase CheX
VYHRLAEILAVHASQVLKAMSGLEAERVVIAPAQAGDGPRHPLGVKVVFAGRLDEPLAGFFICAFADLATAQEIASAIAVKLGLDARLADDVDGTDSLLAEYLNTVTGRTCSDWAELGLTAEFDPPMKLSERPFEAQAGGAAFHLTVSVAGRPDVPIFLVFAPDVAVSGAPGAPGPPGPRGDAAGRSPS